MESTAPTQNINKRDIKSLNKAEEEKTPATISKSISKYSKKRVIIQEGDKVVLVDNSGKMNLVKVKSGM